MDNILFEDVVHFINVLFLLIFLYNIPYMFRLLFQILKINKTPYFNEALEGVYVKFKGNVQTSNSRKNGLLEGSYAFLYQAVDAKGRVKRRKPKSGYESVLQPVLTNVSPQILLKNKSGYSLSVQLDAKKLNARVRERIYHMGKKSMTKSDPIGVKLSAKAIKNYKKYLYLFNWLKKDDEVTVYGRLIKGKEGYFLTDTYNEKLPFMILKGSYAGFLFALHKMFFLGVLVVLSLNVLNFFL